MVDIEIEKTITMKKSDKNNKIVLHFFVTVKHMTNKVVFCVYSFLFNLYRKFKTIFSQFHKLFLLLLKLKNCIKTSSFYSKNRISATILPFLVFIAIIFNILKRPHIDGFEQIGDGRYNELFNYVMGLLSIVLALSIGRILRNGNLFFKFLLDKYLKKSDISCITKDICFRYIFLLILLLFFPIQYWIASYEAFHMKADWKFHHYFLHMIVPIIFYSMSDIVFPDEKNNITKEDYFKSKKIAAYFIILVTIVNGIVDYITLNQSTFFTNTNRLRASLLPLILFIGVVKCKKISTEFFLYLTAILAFVTFIYLKDILKYVNFFI